MYVHRLRCTAVVACCWARRQELVRALLLLLDLDERVVLSTDYFDLGRW